MAPSAGAVAQESPRSRVLGGCARRVLLELPAVLGAGMPRTHLTSSGDIPSASAGISPPFARSSSSSLDPRLSAVVLRAVASSSGHRFIAARGKKGGKAGGREAGDTRRPGPPVVPQVISAPARTHVDKSSSPVRARGAPGQPAGRSVPAASIPLRLPRFGCRVCGARRVAGPAVGGRRRESEKASVSGE